MDQGSPTGKYPCEEDAGERVKMAWGRSESMRLYLVVEEKVNFSTGLALVE